MVDPIFYVLLTDSVAAIYLWLAWDAWRALGLGSNESRVRDVTAAGALSAVASRMGDGMNESRPLAVDGGMGAAALRPTPSSELTRRSRAALALLPLALLGHSILLAHAVVPGGEFRFGFAHALSAMLWAAAFIVWLEGFFVPIRGLDLVVLPLTAVASVLPAVFTGAQLDAGSDTLALRLHLLTAISAYSLLTIAALHAGLMVIMDRYLHGDMEASGKGAKFFSQVPPLLALETLLFRLIGAGFVLLSATILSGVVFSEALFGQPLRFDHKTVFSIAAWLVFGALLTGRLLVGWRGRRALHLTLTGFVMLLLGYVGSRFVLEVVLRRL